VQIRRKEEAFVPITERRREEAGGSMRGDRFLKSASFRGSIVAEIIVIVPSFYF
jgi:hypothetical protein